MKKFLNLVVVFLLFSLFAPNTGKATGFNDLSPDYPFHDEVLYLAAKEYVTGYGDNTFRAGNTVTRAQAAIMIGKALGLNKEPRATKFSDVTSKVTGSGYIASAAERGIINGYTDDTYRPYEPVSRGQMAIFLNNAYTLTIGKVNRFNDVSSKMAAYQSILNVSADGIASGYSDDTYRPNQPVTRGQFSAFLARTLEPSFRSISPMIVKFLDVGQGDAVLIQYPNGENALVDAGHSESAIEDALQAEGITQIDTFIATHPDADHIGGADYVIENYGVTKVFDSGQRQTTQIYEDYLEAVDKSDADFQVVEIGDNITNDPRVDANVLFVDRAASDLDDGSIVMKLSYGETDFLLTGDAGHEVEDYLMDHYSSLELDSDILKVSHHGSNTGTSREFLDAVVPWGVVLSYGENSYGLPHEDVLRELQDFGSHIFSTYYQGNITFETDGVSTTLIDTVED